MKPVPKAEIFRTVRDLDRIALPLIAEYGIDEAYRRAVELIEQGTRKVASEEREGA